MMQTECPEYAALAAYRLGDLPDEVAAAVSGHLQRGCSRCAQALCNLDRAEESILDLLRRYPRPSAPAVPNYKILSEMGRGGMGVVYKARHEQLNRVVALKMILAGSHAGAAERARFQTEAEAIARLQHPNIVQVYEVGEHESKPFFSMGLCDGGSLERKLNGTPLPAREAAALVETLARAMQAAHAQRIIHRDLKPANVLFLEDGTPKITDFGLAKLDEASRTQSGAILGTPSYMAPEQASGQKVERLADVYALGAILYECLTGRPPFKAATALETLRQVELEEPVRPTQLQRTMPRDLETICLKCLHKEPRKRYGSAQDLADDLRRFLNNEPILARPVGRSERVVKFCRRNPVLTVLLIGLALGFTGTIAFAFVSEKNARQARANEEEAKRQTALARETLAKTLTAMSQMLARLNDDKTNHTPGSQELRFALCRELANGSDELVRLWPDDDGVRELAGRFWLQTGLAARYLQSETEALHLLQRAETFLRQRASARPHDPAAKMALAEVLIVMAGRLRRRNEPLKSLDLYQESTRLLTPLLEDANVKADVEALARCRLLYGQAAINEGMSCSRLPEPRLDLALQHFQRGIDILTQGAGEAPNPTPLLENVVLGWVVKAQVFRETKEPQKGLECLDSALRSLELIPHRDREQPGILQQTGNVLNTKGLVLTKLGRPDDALHAYLQAAEIRDRLQILYPDLSQYKAECATVHGNVASSYFRRKQNDLAAKHWERAIQLMSQAVTINPDAIDYITYLTDWVRALAQLYRDERRWEKALDLSRRYAAGLPSSLQKERYVAGLEQMLTIEALGKLPDADEPQALANRRALTAEALANFRSACDHGFMDGKRFQEEIPWKLLQDIPGGDQLLRRLMIPFADSEKAEPPQQ